MLFKWMMQIKLTEYVVYFALSLLVLALTLVLSYLPDAGYGRILGDQNLVLVICSAIIVGTLALYSLQVKFNFSIFLSHQAMRGSLVVVVLATLPGIAIAIVIADLVIRYPENINVPLPEALLFYPAIGFVAEMAFHVVPLAFLLLVLTPLAGQAAQKRILCLCILFVACIEPTYQILMENDGFTWRDVYTWLHIFTISILQLYVFWRYDFISMYLFRMVYYLYWHIIWGTMRLDILF